MQNLRTIFFIIWAFRRGGSTFHHHRSEQPHSITYNLYKAAAPSGCPLQCPAGTGHSTHWSPPFKGARGDSETHTPPSISASIPNARSSKHLHVSRRSFLSPRSNHSPRREPRTRPFPGGFASAPPSATDMQPLTRLTHRLIHCRTTPLSRVTLTPHSRVGLLKAALFESLSLIASSGD